jgi:GGDEF domain-containing protein
LLTSKGKERGIDFQFTLDREFQRAKETGSHLTLFLIGTTDERVGVKDALLGPLEEKVKQNVCRSSDITLRCEQEKMLAALCQVDSNGAQVIEKRIEEKALKQLEKNFDPPLIIRVGAATYPEEALSEKELFEIAQERLRG